MLDERFVELFFYCMKIFRSNGQNLVLDATDESQNNWCCLIPPARTSQEINCLLFQRKHKLYAKVVRTILASESLSMFVSLMLFTNVHIHLILFSFSSWYASNYAKAIGLPETPDGSSLGLSFAKKNSLFSFVIDCNSLVYF